MTASRLHPDLEREVVASAAPAVVRAALARLGEVDPGFVAGLASAPGVARAVVGVTAASRSLGELIVADPAARQVLIHSDRPAGPDQATAETRELVRKMRLELLRIAARDLTAQVSLEEVGRGLADLATSVIQAACRLCGVGDMAIIGMGKLGAGELNYSSDIDVMFVGSDTAGARAVLEVVRRCYRVDVDLRPEGRDGPLIRSLAAFEVYWDRWAQTWEFQALIKARPLAGDEALGSAFARSASNRLWGRSFGPDDLRAVRAMKSRAESELARKGLSEREIKRGRGGIRDIEFSIQLLQMVHGPADPALRSAATLATLAEMERAGYVDSADAVALEAAYRLLRTVEHRLQLVHEQQVHTLPTRAEAVERLARTTGYRDSPAGTAGELFLADVGRNRAAVRSIHQHLFFRPLLDALVGSTQPGQMSDAAIEARLVAFGFTDARRIRAAFAELTAGFTRRSRLMRQTLPLVMSWLSESPDPDLGLLSLRVLASGEHEARDLSMILRDSPEAARALCCLLGTSRRLGEWIGRNPDFIGALASDDATGVVSAAEMARAALAPLAWREDPDGRQPALMRFKRRQELRIASADVLGRFPGGVVAVGDQLTQLAEACLNAALESIEPAVPLAVIGLGRLGGSELSYASDLDLLVVHGGNSAKEALRAERDTEALMRFLGGDTPAGSLYRVDLNLRPEGKDGPLARSLEGYRTYYQRWAQTWERQALVRARPVAGDPGLMKAFSGLVDDFVWRGLTAEEEREIRRMKARIERERIPVSDDPAFHLKLGRGSLSDVEFCLQLLQLRHRIPSPSTARAAVRLEEAGVLDPEDSAVLCESYRFCEQTRNRWFLVKGSAGDALPARADQMAPLARSLGTTPSELRDTYRRVTRRCRGVVERLFYGQG
ncbi:MAG: bifunctional [glutamine synthetase] adenylyltransferase/[glutamine synthetase]-adenylyl-L-tyrosine phosphorylase [Acidimicrobiales bacterium]